MIAQHISGSALESRGFRFLFRAASGVAVYQKGDDDGTRLHVDSMGNIREPDGSFLDNPAFDTIVADE